MSVEKIPVELSATNANAHYHWCKGNQQQRSYYSCIHLMEAIKKGRLDELVEDKSSCAYHYKVGACSAKPMREKEIEEGRSIYFQSKRQIEEKIANVDKSDQSYVNGWNKVGSSVGKEAKNIPVDKPVAKPVAKPVTKVQNLDSQDDFAKAIELAAKRERLAKLKKLKQQREKKA